MTPGATNHPRTAKVEYSPSARTANGAALSYILTIYPVLAQGET
jgi:hypothetical protein